MPQLETATFLPQLVWLLITFVLLYVLMAKVALPRVAAVIDERKRRVDHDLEEAARLKRETEKAIAEYEQALAQALQEVKPQADAAFERGDYAVSLQALAALKAPVDAFFDTVMVNAEDPALRANRLGLLATLHAAMNRVADLSRLAG